MSYADFLNRKTQLGTFNGFEPTFLPDFLFDFQRELVTWATRKGKAALFEDCGLGKTPQQLVWAENVVRQSNKPVLILTPLAVSQQTMGEAHKFDIDAHRSHAGKRHEDQQILVFDGEHQEKQPTAMETQCLGAEDYQQTS